MSNSHTCHRKMRKIVEAKYCKFFKIKKDIDEDMGCDECSAYHRCTEEPNPYKCRDLVFLRWLADEVHLSGEKANG